MQDDLILKFLDSPFNILALCVALLVIVFIALNAKHSLYVLKSLRRNLLRTILTGAATMVLVFVVTVVWTILGFLEQVTEEKSKDFKAIITEKWQIPSQMPMKYATERGGLQEGAPRKKGDYTVPDIDSMTWSFYGGTIDPNKRTRENIIFMFCMEPKKLIYIDDKGKITSMMDGMDEFPRSDLEKLDLACKEMAKDWRKIVVGKERLAAMNKHVGDRITVTSLNYQDINLEFEIIGEFPKGRYDQSAIMNRAYLEIAMDDYKKKQGKAHDMANKTLNLVWLRVPDKKMYEKVAGQVESAYANDNPATKCETASSGVASFLDAYRDLLWGMKWLLVPAVLVTMSLVIANAISISVRERRTEMAVMKVLGYSPNHIMLIVLGEALLIGAGCGFLSNFLAFIYVDYVKGGLAFPIAFFPSFLIPAAALWWGPAIGGLTAFLGSAVPAWGARSVKVSEVFSKIS